MLFILGCEIFYLGDLNTVDILTSYCGNCFSMVSFCLYYYKKTPKPQPKPPPKKAKPEKPQTNKQQQKKLRKNPQGFTVNFSEKYTQNEGQRNKIDLFEQV